jgi:glycerol kinase
MGEPGSVQVPTPSESFIGSIDQGTTSTRFLIFNREGEPVTSHQIEFKQYYPHPGYDKLSSMTTAARLILYRWHEHDPIEIITSIEQCIEGAVKEFEQRGHSVKSIKAVGITNQRETTVVWDHETGEPLANAIVWTDTRNQALVRKLKARLGSDQLQGLCGLPLSTYPSVGKLLWLIENDGKVADAYARGKLAFGTIDAWVVYKLNGKHNMRSKVIFFTVNY